MKFDKFTKYFYTLGFIFAALILSSIGMVNSIFSLDSKGMFIWGIIVVVIGFLLGAWVKEL